MVHTGSEKHLWGGEFRSVGYFISTVGSHTTENVIKQYVKEQGKSEENIQLRLF
jgi:REP element-mobilizing transposase RayT